MEEHRDNNWNDKKVTHDYRLTICEKTAVTCMIIAVAIPIAFLIWTAVNGSHIRSMGLQHRGFERVYIEGHGMEWISPSEAERLRLNERLLYTINKLRERIREVGRNE